MLAQRVKKAEKEARDQSRQHKKEITELQAQMQAAAAAASAEAEELSSVRKQREADLQANSLQCVTD